MGKNNEAPKGGAQPESNVQTDIKDESKAGADASSGTDINANTAAANAEDQPPQASDDEEKIVVLARHKTPHQFYRCAGLVLKKQAENHLVTEAQREKLRHDPWVEVTE